MKLYILLYSALLTAHLVVGQELLENGGFENGNFKGNWRCGGCTMEQSSLKHSGQFSVKVTKRTSSSSGPVQRVKATKGAFYEFESYVQLLNDQVGVVQTRLEAWRHVRYADGKDDWKAVAIGPYLRSTDGWRKVGGSFRAPDKDMQFLEISLRGPDPSVSFLVDSISMKLIPELSGNWKADALQRIEQIRKDDLTINLTIGSEYNLDDVEVEVKQTSSAFPFGGMIKARQIVDPNQIKYRQFVYDTFEWTTISNALKFRMMQWKQYPIDYDTPRLAIEELLSHGVKIRGHNVVWGVEDNVPKWLKTMTADQVKAALDARIQGVVGTFKGNLSHWDVNNEVIAGHGDWFEQNTGDRYITEKMFQKIHSIDPDVKLFHNEFRVINSGAITDAYVDMIQEYKAKGLPLYGIGVQGHLPVGPPDILKIQQNLDKLAVTGLPVWITELDIESSDVAKRGEYYEDVMTYLFSHPAVQGIILWVWHDNGKPWRDNVNLAQGNGDAFQVNAAGLRVRQLLKKTWRTNVVQKPTAHSSTLRLRGFKGEYTITIKNKGAPVTQKSVTLGQGGVTTSLQAGSLSTTTLSSGLTCVNRWSGFSEIGDDKPVAVPCGKGEIMTGCSSRSRDNKENRDGEVFGWDPTINQRVCKAYNGHGSTAPVQAIARCCKGPSDLQCSYSSSQVSAKGDGEQAVRMCPAGSVPTGCTTHNYFAAFDGSFPKMNKTACVAQNDGVKGGVFSHAACCKANGLQCVVKYSDRSGDFRGNITAVTCDAGYTITGCNVFNEFGGTAGAFTAILKQTYQLSHQP
ncbi:uncharacterized protein LOC106180638 [Lingula anatina]|uniref:Uncharacterized protein LOC106180638 n=1 Tax=Lingula anatina TaxID=7574 RepID=A0A1S3KCA3_LINAN|nr:uncharacterized protein LOC106180638 [Lingula anatina]|eukprot:XP_013420122.1 uncharacterized protein LOC106180638 [Lingula anatina]